MSDEFRVIYPLTSFDGGKNNKYDPSIIADNESPSALNCVFDDLGGVQTRLGSKKLNTTSVGSFAGDGLFTARFNDGTEVMLGWWNGTMYKLAAGGTTFTTVASAQSVFTAGTRVDMAMYQNLCFFGNGGSRPYKYNGTEFTRMGIAQPNSGPSDTSGTAGASGPSTGDVLYKVSYVNSYAVEGDVSAQTTTLNVATTATVSLTSLPLAPVSFGVAARKLYRKDSGSGGAFKLVTTINDNTTTTFLDQVVSANLGATAPTDQGIPPNWRFVKSHQERLWLNDPSNKSYLYYTELGNPFVVKTTNFILMGDGDGEQCTGISVHADNIAFYKDFSIWMLYLQTTTPGDWLRIKSLSHYGSASHYAICDFNQYQMFLGKRYGSVSGFYTLMGVNTVPNPIDTAVTGVHADAQSVEIEPDVLAFLKSLAVNASGIEFNNKLWFTVPSGVTSTTNDMVYQFDFQRRDNDPKTGSWMPFTYPMNIACFTVYAGKLYAQEAGANGFCYQLELDATYNDSGTAINSYWQSKDFSGRKEHIENQKDFRFANFTVETFGNFFMNVRHRTDSDTSLGTTNQISLDSGGNLWGTMVWGTSNWGGTTARKKVTIPLGPSSGKKISFRFDNQNVANSAFHVFSEGSFIYNKRGYR